MKLGFFFADGEINERTCDPATAQTWQVTGATEDITWDKKAWIQANIVFPTVPTEFHLWDQDGQALAKGKLYAIITDFSPNANNG